MHQAVVAAFAKDVPSWVNLTLPDDYSHADGHSRSNDEEYIIYPQKFMRETWDTLSRAAVARMIPEFGDYGVSQALGLTLMAALADACAGTEQHRITDRVDAYSALAGMTSLSLGGELLQNSKASEVTETIDRLVTISANVMDGSSIPLARLLALRQQEANESSQDLRRMRHKYLDSVKSHLKALSEATTENDARELSRQFREEMERDLFDLKKELGMARNDVLLSKEMGVLLLAAAGAATAPIVGTALAATAKTIGVGALLSTGTKFKRARAKALREHPTSWLYVAGHPVRGRLR